LLPSLEREIRRELTEEAQEHAVTVFARNLRSLLLQPPLRGRRVLAIDPGFRTGCKIAALDETGNLVEDGIIFLPSGRGPGGKGRRLQQTRGGRGEPPTAPLEQPPPVGAPSQALPAGVGVAQVTTPPDVGFPISIELPPMLALPIASSAPATVPPQPEPAK